MKEPTRSEAIFSHAAVVVTIIVAVVLCYWDSSPRQLVNLDDEMYLKANIALSEGLSYQGICWAFTNLSAGYWMPVTWISYMADIDLFGFNVLGFYVVNVLFHLVDSILVYILFVTATRSIVRSALVALFFAVHPLHVESVAWIAGRKDVLFGMFGVVGFWLYSLYARDDRRKWFAGSLVAFTLSLMSKPMLVTLPVLLLLFDYWPLQRIDSSNLRARIVEKIPFAILAAIFAVGTIMAMRSSDSLIVTDTIPILYRISIAIMAVPAYLSKTFLPMDLSVFYPLHKYQMTVWRTLASGALVVVVTAIAFTARHRHPCLIAGWFFFLVAISPMLGFTQSGAQAFADRFTYFPHIGFFAAILFGVAEIVAANRKWPMLASTLCMTAILGMAVASRAQAAAWKDPILLYRHALRVTHDVNWFARHSLTQALFNTGRDDEALFEAARLVEMFPTLPDGYEMRGLILMRKGRIEDAIRDFYAAVAIAPKIFTYRYYLGVALSRAKRFDEAENQFNEVVGIAPVSAVFNLCKGVLASDRGDKEEAIRFFSASSVENPRSFEAHKGLADALVSQGRYREALAAYDSAILINSNSVETIVDAGKVLIRMGRTDEAISRFREALRYNPDQKAARAEMEKAEVGGAKRPLQFGSD